MSKQKPPQYSYEFPRPSLTVDCVIFGFSLHDESLKILLVRRGNDPFKGRWANPGGFVEVLGGASGQGESLNDAAHRELKEETGIDVGYLEQLYTFGYPGRDPRGRVVTVAYMALVQHEQCKVVAGSDAADAQWFPLRDVLGVSLAFDHAEIVQVAVDRLRAKVRYAPIGFDLLPREFTLGDLHRLYEVVLDRDIDASNFRKKVTKKLIDTGVLTSLGTTRKGQHRPAPLYRFDLRAYRRALKTNDFHFDI